MRNRPDSLNRVVVLTTCTWIYARDGKDLMEALRVDGKVKGFNEEWPDSVCLRAAVVGS
jgi:hypothetical protein